MLNVRKQLFIYMPLHRFGMSFFPSTKGRLTLPQERDVFTYISNEIEKIITKNFFFKIGKRLSTSKKVIFLKQNVSLRNFTSGRFLTAQRRKTKRGKPLIDSHIQFCHIKKNASVISSTILLKKKMLNPNAPVFVPIGEEPSGCTEWTGKEHVEAIDQMYPEMYVFADAYYEAKEDVKQSEESKCEHLRNLFPSIGSSILREQLQLANSDLKKAIYNILQSNDKKFRNQFDLHVCKYNLSGQCKNGVNCPYTHDREVPSAICKYWLQDICMKSSDECIFLHKLPKEPVVTYPTSPEDGYIDDTITTTVTAEQAYNEPLELLEVMFPRVSKKN
ncbi:hypothetical protein RFI_06383 [Reticulomyxa filosa]|uniref:Uncharacterized protein n=1 Tax=Reticulomyxa filosa TaxID=46433 RepID=X6NWN6_RETFI|nr:hypothetical protein RFI_06383 [Reticulomyxa filosa]|eukprot:ETO30735.1 hypothetical protein RFI_06383 [Reticulomyxa filosa]